MRTALLWIGMLGSLLRSPLHAQDIAGDWQGTIMDQAQPLRTIMQISRADGGGWKVSLLSVDQSGTDHPRAASSVTLEGSVLKVTFNQLGGVYDGKLGADGHSISGTWKQTGEGPFPLDYQRVTKETAWRDLPHHDIRFVTVEKDVRLEVLDWGGSGRPVVLLAGLGNAGHIFDALAPKLTSAYHVYGITRRGFGASSVPVSGYSADRLADDVLAVIDSVGLVRPVLVGHSIAGEELSSVGSRHPDKVSGLIYLDAGYPYAYYDTAHGDLSVDHAELQRKLEELRNAYTKTPDEFRRVTRDLLDSDLPAFELSLRAVEKNLPAPAATPARPQPAPPPIPAASLAIRAGEQKYTRISGPVLAIYAFPHKVPPAIANDTAARARFISGESTTVGVQAAAFERGVPSARVVRLPNADHYVFRSNESDVLREIRAFIESLPAAP
jgi:non-heme chloroperoxidase